METAIIYGLGTQGRLIAQLAVEKGIKIVGVVDMDPNFVGKDLGEVLRLKKKVGVTVSKDVESILREVKADIVLHSTVTYLKPVYEQIKPCIEAGINVMSISEELSYPWRKYPKLSKEIDDLAKKHEVTVIGTGINPGLVMDLVPLIYCQSCWRVDSIKIRRAVDTTSLMNARRAKRYGCSPDEFKRRLKEGEIQKHIGFIESMTMICDALRWKLDNIHEAYEIITSKSRREIPPWVVIEPGTVCGWKQTATGLIEGEAKIVLEIHMIAKLKLEEDGVEKGDFITIMGKPSIFISDKGDTADNPTLLTAARMVNYIKQVVEAKPGLLSVKDLPIA